MKTTLIQAWEARGLYGVALRWKVRWELIGRFYKENPDKNKAGDRAAFELAGAALFGYVAFVYLHYAAPYMRALDFSLSLSLGIVLMVGVSFFIFVVLAIILAKFAVEDAVAAYGLDRYVVQHRDDEVEL